MSTDLMIPEDQNTAIATPIDGSNPIAGMYSSISAESIQERLQLFDSVSNAQSLEDHINECINVENVIIQPVEIIDKLTGELTTQNRITLIDNNGVAYACVSIGVETSMKQLFAIVGKPPWVGGIPLKPVKQQGNNGYEFTSLQLFKGE